MDVFLQTLEGWVYIVPIHGPLYTGSHIHQHPPRSLNNRRNGVQDWTRREYKESTKGKYPPVATTSHLLR